MPPKGSKSKLPVVVEAQSDAVTVTATVTATVTVTATETETETVKEEKAQAQAQAENLDVQTSVSDCALDNDACSVISTSTSTSTSVRSKKPKVVYAADPVNVNELTIGNAVTRSVEEDDNVIMKLNVKSDIVDEATEKHDGIPDAYNENCNEISLFALEPDVIENGSDECVYSQNQTGEVEKYTTSDIHGHGHGHSHGQSQSQSAGRNLRVVHLLKDFEEKNKNNEWPATTSISCYWCCHSFATPPFGIPVKYVHQKFHVYGCFCSLECAAAHNLSNTEIMDDVWERNQLINILSRRIGGPNIVKAAPPRLALKMFGGYLSIEEFRDFCNSSKLININFPPMMTLTQQVEEINESDLNNEYKYIPVDTDRINKFKLKLKRSKPPTHMKNTLDNVVKVGA